MGLIVIILGGASLFLAAFYPQQTRQRIQADKNIKNSRGVIRFLRAKMALNGTMLIVLGVLLWSRWAQDYVVGIAAIILLGFSYYLERAVKVKSKG